MPRWNPEAIWKDEDVFIIGGGHSLRDFDWSLLKQELTVGCNTAFTLGADICKVCIFGDLKWYTTFKSDLSQFEGTVFTNVTQLQKPKNIPSWLWVMDRKARGLHRDALGWNNNTGASAINLALLLGACRVFLLGFDMTESQEGKPNWHDKRIEPHTISYVDKFVPAFGHVAADLKSKFPGCSIHNISDNTALNTFPIIGTQEFWSQRIRDRKRVG